ncbi:uncharacterized protein CLUP02_07664 [Colletotrichum lupini]|uniref:Uncharacterized protein n=1 Tax=Colletotrichum lupini TaxID=145971 RepID=A0A9Q8WFW2_9PEZI|nr:uncharacterized protein CLUP02_07664 [Colletotrichum lupini]UQC82178.1 hypothetical protein CLUP02_07664 [Colletotrichum lupini]
MKNINDSDVQRKPTKREGKDIRGHAIMPTPSYQKPVSLFATINDSKGEVNPKSAKSSVLEVDQGQPHLVYVERLKRQL